MFSSSTETIRGDVIDTALLSLIYLEAQVEIFVCAMNPLVEDVVNHRNLEERRANGHSFEPLATSFLTSALVMPLGSHTYTLEETHK